MAAHTPMILSEIAVPIAERVHKPSFIASFANKQFYITAPLKSWFVGKSET
jgi:hypothetical protein